MDLVYRLRRMALSSCRGRNPGNRTTWQAPVVQSPAAIPLGRLRRDAEPRGARAPRKGGSIQDREVDLAGGEWRQSQGQRLRTERRLRNRGQHSAGTEIAGCCGGRQLPQSGCCQHFTFYLKPLSLHVRFRNVAMFCSMIRNSGGTATLFCHSAGATSPAELSSATEKSRSQTGVPSASVRPSAWLSGR